MQSTDTLRKPPDIGGGLSVDAAALAEKLRARIQGEVRFDRASRAIYATDGSNYRQVPIGVVIPRTKQDVIDTVALCHEFGAPILSRGGGTSLAGQCCNVAVVMDMSKYYNRILELDIAGKKARIQPGLVLDTLRHAAEKHNLTFGPDPATHSHCTLGGMMGNNSCGVHAQMAGKTVDNVISLEVLTYDGLILEVGETSDDEFACIVRDGGRRGEIYAALRKIRDTYADEIRARYPKIPRRVSGYNIDSLLPEYKFNVAQALVGSESTLVTILEATVRLVYRPPERTLVVLGYPDVYRSADHVTDILKHKPIALEGVDQTLVEKMKKKKPHSTDTLLPKGGGWLLVEFGAETKAESDAQAHKLVLALGKTGATSKIFDDEAEEKEVWGIRESGLGATAFIPDSPDTWEGWEDSAVHPENLGAYLRDLKKLYDRYNFEGALYGHFGQGCVHTRITFDLVTRMGVEKFRAFLDDASDLVMKYGGSFSGEHGDGQSRAELLPKMFGHKLIGAFEEFKRAWDPRNKMNPGKIVHAYKILDNLRLGPTYDPLVPETHFEFPHDKFDFSRSALRCVGVGECRRDEKGTMCPSSRVTREEMHSTRGRSRLLFEMLRGEVIKDGWKSEEVKEALDLCLACKGCKGDCPVNVDMATYKAEFLSHYYEGKLRPRSAYAFGLIYWWARLASLAPRVVNFVTQTPGLSRLAKFFAGMAPERSVPKFAPETFKNWFKRRVSRDDGKPPVILWADTFNNHFHPEVAKAAVHVLEEAGFRVIVPAASLCCGRPLYDYGWLDQAKRMLRQILDTLREEIQQGIPVVGLEPSCVAVFRDELHSMFPHDKDALRLREQTFTLSEFLVKRVKDYAPPPLRRKALVQGHCHHKSVMGFKEETELIQRLGLDADEPDSGCCGMAGSFGFEQEHYDVSMKCGEQIILPEARKASADTIVIADGFSCREQISQGAGRAPKHIAEVIEMAINGHE
jgi:FAD/FMN-containing dehydrogenase/Fe-S oxidoreductase